MEEGSVYDSGVLDHDDVNAEEERSFNACPYEDMFIRGIIGTVSRENQKQTRQRSVVR